MPDPIKLKNLIVYPEQQSAAHEIASSIAAGVTNIVLRAKPQCGKTTTFIYLAHIMMGLWDGSGEKYTIYSVLADSNNELLKQTKERWAEAGFNYVHYEDKIKHYHRAQFKKAEISKDDKRRLIIIDEAHLSGKKGSQLDELLKNIDYDYKSGENTGFCENVVVSVSATPYGHMASHYMGLSNFTFIELPTSPQYYGIDNAYDDNRIEDALRIVEKGELNEKLKCILQKFQSKNQKKNLVIRLGSSSGKQGTFLKEYLETIDLKFHEFHSVKSDDKIKSLDAVDGAISTAPLVPTVIIIYGALRAGKTLGTTQHIYAWCDSKSMKADTVYQSIGRLFGYTAEGHSKFDDTFPIYTNMGLVKQILSNQVNDAIVPSGQNNGLSVERVTYGEPVIAEKAEDGRKYIVYNIDPIKNPDVPLFGEMTTDGVHTMSANNSRDFAKFVLTGAQWDYMRVLHCDGPAPGFEKSWEELNVRYHNLVGEYIVRKPLKKDIQHKLSGDTIY
jgi:hypothetical protein